MINKPQRIFMNGSFLNDCDLQSKADLIIYRPGTQKNLILNAKPIENILFRERDPSKRTNYSRSNCRISVNCSRVFFIPSSMNFPGEKNSIQWAFGAEA